MFNAILSENGLSPRDVRLLRHADTKAPKGTPYEFWRYDRDSKFVLYQEHQEIKYRNILNAKYWATFVVVPPENKTVLAGLYRVQYVRTLNADEHKNCPVHHRDYKCDQYKLMLDEKLKGHIGRLVIEWGPGFNAWIQYANRRNKRVIEPVLIAPLFS
jgi:hypothetical protein